MRLAARHCSSKASLGRLPAPPEAGLARGRLSRARPARPRLKRGSSLQEREASSRLSCAGGAPAAAPEPPLSGAHEGGRAPRLPAGRAGEAGGAACGCPWAKPRRSPSGAFHSAQAAKVLLCLSRSRGSPLRSERAAGAR